MTVGPYFLAVVLISAAGVSVMARNVGGVNASGGAREIPVWELLRCVVLQSATLAGLLIALVAASMFVENCLTRNQRDLFAELETDPFRRWLVQIAVVLTAMLLAAVCASLVVLALSVSLPLLRGEGIVFELRGFGQLLRSWVFASSVWLLFAAGSVCLARIVRAGPVATIGLGAVVTMNLLVVQHLVPIGLERAVPTAWVGQWQRLAGDDYGIAYFWTVGTFPGGRGLSGLLLLASLVAAVGIGIHLTRTRT